MEELINSVIEGDCIEVMKKFPDNFVDAVITDPPYGINILNLKWDKFKRDEYIIFTTKWGQEVYRILKPGGYLLSFSSIKTMHYQLIAFEDIGFENRNCIFYLYSNKFIGTWRVADLYMKKGIDLSFWKGWGYNIVISCDPILVLRKSFEKDLVTNLLKWNIGLMNLEACKIGQEMHKHEFKKCRSKKFYKSLGDYKSILKGRLPKNVIFGCTCNSGNNGYHSFDCVCYGLGNAVKYYYCVDFVKKTEHPTEKPLELLMYLVKLVVPKGGLLLDCFAGSGTTLIACKKLGYRYIGIEKEKEYCDLARKRLEQVEKECEEKEKELTLFDI